MLCWDEGRIHATSYVAEALGLRNGDLAVIWRLRDKGQTRAALDLAGVAQPRSIPVRTVADALAAAEVVGYPAILKPRGLGASLGVVEVQDPVELRHNFAFTRDTTAPDPVVYANDYPALGGGIRARRGDQRRRGHRRRRGHPAVRGPQGRRLSAYFEEVGHFVDAADPLLRDPALLAALQDTHAALGVTDGFTHSEFMLERGRAEAHRGQRSAGRRPHPLPGPARHRDRPGPGGGLGGVRPRAVGAADPGPGRGHPVLLCGHRRHHAGVGVLRCPGAAGADRVRGGGGPTGRRRVAPAEGNRMGRIAFAIAAGESVDVCREALDAAGRALEIKAEVPGAA